MDQVRRHERRQGSRPGRQVYHHLCPTFIDPHLLGSGSAKISQIRCMYPDLGYQQVILNQTRIRVADWVRLVTSINGSRP